MIISDLNHVEVVSEEKETSIVGGYHYWFYNSSNANAGAYAGAWGSNSYTSTYTSTYTSDYSASSSSGSYSSNNTSYYPYW